LKNINSVIESSGKAVEHVIVGGDSAGGHLTLSSQIIGAVRILITVF